MKKVIFLFFIAFFFIMDLQATTTAEFAIFERCVDGDTAVFRINDESFKFRFLAIDTPETVHPTIAIEEYGKNASEYTCNKLSNAKEIIVEYEESNTTDKYGRKLAWIWVDGSLLQKELVSIGYAQVAYIYGDYRYTQSLCLNQKNAINLKYGMWSSDTEEGYCSTIDITNEIDIIDYDKIANKEENAKQEEEKYKETGEKIIDIFNSVKGFSESFASLGKKYKSSLDDIILWAIIISAIIRLIVKTK